MPQQEQPNDPERWTTTPVPVDERWLERFTRTFRLRGSDRLLDPLRPPDLELDITPQPPRRVAA